MQSKRIIHFDTIYSTKINNNPFNTNFQLTEYEIIIFDLNRRIR